MIGGDSDRGSSAGGPGRGAGGRGGRGGGMMGELGAALHGRRPK